MAKKLTTKAKVFKYLHSHMMLVAGVAVFAVLGIVMLSVSRASTGTTSAEAEAGTANNGALLAVDSSASGGKAIVFGAANPTTVQIGSQTFILNGTNAFRDIGQMVRYTYSSAQTATPTNMYGVEVVVSLSTNKVTAVNDRIASNDAAATQIPEGSYVLSGHSQGGTTAGQWLRDNAKVGATVMLSGSGMAVTPTPSPTPGPNPTPPPSGSTGLRSKIVGAYWQMWQGPKVSEITSSAPQYDIQYASFALGSDTNGHVAFNPVFQSGTSLKNDIAASKAAGSKWLISLGGGSDKTIRLTNETQASNMFDSLVGIIDSYGFQGIDYDLECGSSCFQPDAAVSLAKKLKAKYGKGFIVSAAPRPYEARGSSSIYGSFALKAGDNMDLFGLQFYDFPETRNTAQLTALINSDVATVVNMGVPPSKILIGAITYTQYNLGWNTVDVYKNIFKQQEQKYPALRGVFIWESSLDKKENWSFAKGMGSGIR